MSDHGDPLHFGVDSTKKTWLYWPFAELLLRPLRRVVGSLFGSSSKLVFARENPHSAGMASVDPIDISSSDDSILREIDEYFDESPLRDSATSSNARSFPNWAFSSSSNMAGRGSTSSSNARTLPSWAMPSPSNTAVNGGPSRTVSSPKRPFASNGSSSHFTSPGISKAPIHATTSGYIGTSYSHTAGVDSSEFLSNNDDEWRSTKRVRWTHPTSVQTSQPNFRSNNLVEDVSSSHFRESHGNASQSTRPNSTNSLNYHFGRGTDDAVMYENRGSRMLPPSLAYGKYTSATYANLSEPHRGLGEERQAGNDERMILQAALKGINQPTRETDLPEGVLSVSLLRHQKIALAWMMERETAGVYCSGGILADDQGLGKTISMIALIQKHRSLQEDSKSEKLSTTKAEAFNLDNDEEENAGSTPEKPKIKGESDDLEELSGPSSSMTQFRNKRPAAGTLVICPASVLRQWARELDEKVSEEHKLSVLIYHGGNRTREPSELAKYDVVLTTYAIVTIEVPKQPLVEEEDNDHNNGERYGLSSEFHVNKKQKKASCNKKVKKGKRGTQSDGGALASVRWFRVILDEAQTIKNHRTQIARACCTLRAKRRWCLSGTPIQNTIDELFSYFRFLRYHPYSQYKEFIANIKLLISRDSIRGYTKLQVVLRGIMLRRTKGTLLDGKPIITLPPKTTCLTKVDFSAEERAFYNKLEADSRSQFKAYAAAGTVNQNYANILLMLLRLRQACDHPQLVKGFSSDSVGIESSETLKRLSRQKIQYLLGQLEMSLAICGSCNDPPENAVVTICGHVFCFQCVSDYLTGEDTTCPESGCKQQLSADVIFSKAALQKCLSSDFDSYHANISGNDEKSAVLKDKYSSKIKAALDIIQSCCKLSLSSERNEMQLNGDASSSGNGAAYSQISRQTKAIVFSQWTSMLDLVEISLNSSGIEYRRLDGTMSLAARDRAVKEFNTNPEVTVMLMSLKAGNLGLNMVAASHVILLDLWWNPTTEDQAVDRAHRIGQTRPVTVSRLTVKDTVEDRILALQEEKRKMVASAFGEDPSGGSATRLTIDDLRFLFEGESGQTRSSANGLL
ncbi:helicase-like transcription factor CHR28 isoform X1 [Coffea arabica]|uniref:Helicase-like transcription factor CHR28 isoform X1 n=2 Tax=Coffea arabica TaxID=13443 RepID=A0A6P6V3R4_COFAR|nr:helicase-like transcription factor CHR28 isoform X1 [Coffea arabica]XP_027097488.1 helicase-like transcription factor CHR28 isoform X1 [Coffea arabica]